MNLNPDLISTFGSELPSGYVSAHVLGLFKCKSYSTVAAYSMLDENDGLWEELDNFTKLTQSLEVALRDSKEREEAQGTLEEFQNICSDKLLKALKEIVWRLKQGMKEARSNY